MVKCSATDLDAFTSPNYPPLAELNIDVNMHGSNILPINGDSKGLCVRDQLCRNVVMLRIFPSITTETVRAFFQPPVEGDCLAFLKLFIMACCLCSEKQLKQPNHRVQNIERSRDLHVVIRCINMIYAACEQNNLNG